MHGIEKFYIWICFFHWELYCIMGLKEAKYCCPFIHRSRVCCVVQCCTGNGLVEKPSCRCRFSTKCTNVCQRGQSRGNVLSKESKESQSDQAHRYQISLHSTTYQFKSAGTRVCSNRENGRRYDDERTPKTQI